MIFRRCRARPRLRVALAVLGLLYLFAAAADFLAPYPEGAETSHLSFQPPNRVRVFREGQFVRPYIYALERTLDMETFEQVWLEDKAQVYPVQVFVRRTISATGVAERYVPFPLSLVPEPLRARWGVEPSASLRLFGVDDPRDRVRLYLWGADGFGGDVFGNISFGARVSMTLGLLAALITVPIGVLVGTLAAFAGGALRSLLLGLADALTAIPGVFWVLLLSSAFPAAAASTTATYFLLLGSIAAVGWGTLARGVDAQLRTLQREAFASAARALGNSEWRVVRRHLLPNAATYIVVSAGVLALTFILLESLVSFFGLGVQLGAADGRTCGCVAPGGARPGRGDFGRVRDHQLLVDMASRRVFVPEHAQFCGAARRAARRARPASLSVFSNGCGLWLSVSSFGRHQPR